MTIAALDFFVGQHVVLLCDYANLPQGSVGVVLSIMELQEAHHTLTVSFLGGALMDFDYADALEMLASAE